MTFRQPLLVFFIVAVSWLASDARSIDQETLARAKDLYALAAYDEALILLEKMPRSPTGDDATEIAGYQVLCLLALGRTDEARQAIEALVRENPLYRPSEAMASPRTRALFDDVRRGLLPGIVQERYDKAKAAFDGNDPQLAAAEFDRVLDLLDEPGMSGLPEMLDLGRLAEGFRDLSRARLAAASPPPAAEKAPATVKAPEPVTPAAPVTYSAEDADVVPPTLVSRDMPPWAPRNRLEADRSYHGVIAVVIDEKGDVISAVIGKSVHPAYDAPLLKMARTWKFRPATKKGVPVRYRRGIEIHLRPGGGEGLNRESTSSD